MEYLGDLIQFTGGLVSAVDTMSFFIGAVACIMGLITFAWITDD